MDRLYWCDGGTFLPGEKSVGQQRGVRLYDGEERVNSLHFSIILLLIFEYRLSLTVVVFS